MKANTKVLALMTALAAGAAGMAGAETLSGTPITNVASASFTIPNPDGSTSSGSVTSNTVTTVVMPKPSFDIIFQSNTPADGGTENTQNALATTKKEVTGVNPGQSVETVYTVSNDGNVALSIAIAADETGATNTTDQVVKYYRRNTDGTRGTEITAPLSLAAGATQDIIQVVTVPTNADTGLNTDGTPKSVWGASPEGSVAGTGTGTVTDNGNGTFTVAGNGIANGTTVYEDEKAENTDLQFVRIKLYTPVLNNTPVTTIPGTGTVTPPGSTTTTPGYTDPTNPATEIVVDASGDNQKAYPPADTNATADVVTFINTVTNSGTQADPVNLIPKSADGTTLVWNATAGGFIPTGTTYDPATTVVVKLLSSTGAALPTVDLNSDGTPDGYTVTVPANGGTVNYRTQVTYPDSDSLPNYLSGTPLAPNPYDIVIGVDSGLDGDNLSDNDTTDSIYPPQMTFGDAAGTGIGGVDAGPNMTIQTVNVNAAVDTTPVDSPNTTDRTATFPMEIGNTGAYAETYTLSGTVTIGGTPQTVKYYYANGTEVGKVGGVYTTTPVQPGAELAVYAVVDVPAGTASGDYILSQTATGTQSGIVKTDNNDIIRVSAVGGVVVGKFTQNHASTTLPAAGSEYVTGNPGSGSITAPAAGTPFVNNPAGYTYQNTQYKPTDTYRYRILAKNTYNTAVNGFSLTDTVNANLTYNSATCTITLASGTAGPACAVDASAAPTIKTAAMTLPAGATMTLEINVTVK